MIKVINKLERNKINYADLANGDLILEKDNDACIKISADKYFNIAKNYFNNIYNSKFDFECTSMQYFDMKITYSSKTVPLSEIKSGDVFFFGGKVYLKLAYGKAFRLPQFSEESEVISAVEIFMSETDIKVSPAILEITIGE